MESNSSQVVPGITEYLAALKASAKFGPQVVCHRIFNTKAAEFIPIPDDMDPQLVSGLANCGIEQLYSHQGAAIQSILSGQDTVVATATASGKSLIYSIPVLLDLCGASPGHSLYLSPLKALAQDQYGILNKQFTSMPQNFQKIHQPFAALFDGDSSTYMRRKVRNSPPRVLLTNPEMVHLSILPCHQNWEGFLSNLRYVILDEVHSYRGVMGSHMAWVLRRLQRITARYGANPTFILLSATIGNPAELGGMLIGRRVHIISESGAAQAERNMVFLNPWDSAAFTASQLLEAALKRGLRTIVYTQSRKMTELINLWTAPRIGGLAKKLSAYRAGFLPEERREIEDQLFSGKLLGVISTSALELGIDIGDLDLCLLVGYPGSVMSTMQRGGRVGRGNRPSATILIAGEDALDQYFMRNPDDFFSRSPESAVINPANSNIVEKHLLCCAAEQPLKMSEKLLNNEPIINSVHKLVEAGQLLETASGGQWISSRKNPQRHINLRGGGRQMSIVDSESGEIIGEIDNVRGLKECHPGAVYLHRSMSYVVNKLDLLSNEVVATQESPKFFTRPLSDKRTEILEVIETKQCFGVHVHFGRIRVSEQVSGYQKRHSQTHKLIATYPLELPEMIIETEGLWLVIDPTLQKTIEDNKLHFMGAIHALEHAMIAMIPLLVLCDRNDIGGISCPLHDQTESASVFIYDGYAGGIGLTREAYEKMHTLLSTTLQTISNCPCENGCPSCVHSPKCGSGNRPIDKRACHQLLKHIVAEKTELPIKQVNISVPQCPPVKRSVDLSNDYPLGLAALPDNFCVFDLETIRSAEEVGGWGKAHRMGVSVAVLFDSLAGECITFLEGEMDQLIERLQRSDLIVGFNNKRFDNVVLSAYTKENLSLLPTLDLLEEIHGYLGYRLSLNRLAEVTLGEKKSADGLQALQWYKEGRIDLIQKYCRKDVIITRDLLYYALEKGYLLFSNKAKQEVRLPLALDKKIAAILQNN